MIKKSSVALALFLTVACASNPLGSSGGDAGATANSTSGLSKFTRPGKTRRRLRRTYWGARPAADSSRRHERSSRSDETGFNLRRVPRCTIAPLTFLSSGRPPVGSGGHFS